MTGFKKFGNSNDQAVLSDEKDTQGVRKESAKLDRKSREELLEEVREEMKDLDS